MLPRLGQETVPNQFLTRQVTLPTQDRFAVAQHSSRSFPTGNCSAPALLRQRRRGGLLAPSPLKQGDCFQDANISQVHALVLPMSPATVTSHQRPEDTCLCFLMTFYSPKWCSHACDNGLIFSACRLALGSCECPCGARGLREAMERVFQGNRFRNHIRLSLSQQH